MTWRAYGSWLPGDERGWKKKGECEWQSPDLLFQEMAESAMSESAFRLDRKDRSIVEATVQRHCSIRHWDLHAVDARTNHVHIVLTAPSYKPETVRNQLKAWCTRKLKAIHPTRKNFWAEGGSRRWLNTREDLDKAIKYVNDAQDRKGKEEIQTRRASE